MRLMTGRFALVPILSLAIGAADSRPGPAANDLWVEVDLSDRVLTVHHDSAPPAHHQVAVGRPGHRTPEGSFEMDSIVWNPGWVPPDRDWAKDARVRRPGDPNNPMQAAKIFFRKPYYYIHGTNDPESLGEAASHGCIRMDPEEVTRLARLLMEHAGEARSDAWFDWIRENPDHSVSVSLPQPIRLVIRP